MSRLSTHVLDTTAGEPAAALAVELEYRERAECSWTFLNRDRTDADGRLQGLLGPGQELRPGQYRMRFDTADRSPFFPEIVIQFAVVDPLEHYHVPLLLTRYGYSTYRGS
jgi:5-hydroxyisourate hydrolase